jgi:hypothetical protein
VLDGIFQDEHGDFPAGCYIRNPPTSSHTPGSLPGCTIFVKLWQFDPGDRAHVSLDTTRMPYLPDPRRAEVELMPLFQDGRESVRLERWAPNAEVDLAATGGLELLVLDGGFHDGSEAFEALSWLRLPPGMKARVAADPSGCRAWVKTGHLAFITTPSRSADSSTGTSPAAR